MTDANSCTATTTGTITQPAAVIASSSNTAILCNGGNSTVTVSASGGTPPYNGTGTFSRSCGHLFLHGDRCQWLHGDHDGKYHSAGCAGVASSSNTAILCNGGSSTVTVSATGGTAPYSGTGTFSRSAGTYSFTVTDANSCTATTTGNITQPTALTLGLVAGCNGVNSGFITATFGGGTGPISEDRWRRIHHTDVALYLQRPCARFAHRHGQGHQRLHQERLNYRRPMCGVLCIDPGRLWQRGWNLHQP